MGACIAKGKAMAAVRTHTNNPAAFRSRCAERQDEAEAKSADDQLPVPLLTHNAAVSVVSCFSLLRSVALCRSAQAVDKEKLEVSVKDKLRAVGEAAKALAQTWAARNAAGEVITLAQQEMAPTTLEVIEKNAIPLKLDGASKQESRLKSAVMICGNAAQRQQITVAVIADIKHELVAQKLPEAVIKKAEEKLPELLAKALENQIVGMANKAGKGEPLISPEDEKKIAEYKAKKAAQEAEEAKKKAEGQ